MNTKLTLSMDKETIEKAKKCAKKRQISLSRLVARYLAFLSRAERPPKPDELPPVTRSLWGALEGAPADEGSYLAYLEEKYR